MPEITEIIETCEYRPNGEQGDLPNCMGGVHWEGVDRNERKGLCPNDKIERISKMIVEMAPRNSFFQPKIDFNTFSGRKVLMNDLSLNFGQFWDFLKDDKIGHLFFGGIKAFPAKMSAALSVFAYILFYHANNVTKLRERGMVGVLFETRLKDAYVTRNFFGDDSGGPKGWPIKEGGFYLIFNQSNCQLSSREEAQRHEMWVQILNIARVAIGVNVCPALQSALVESFGVPVIHGPYSGVL